MSATLEYRIRVSVDAEPGEIGELAEMIADVLAEAIRESLQPDPMESDDPFDRIERLSGIYNAAGQEWTRMVLVSRVATDAGPSL